MQPVLDVLIELIGTVGLVFLIVFEMLALLVGNVTIIKWTRE